MHMHMHLATAVAAADRRPGMPALQRIVHRERGKCEPLLMKESRSHFEVSLLQPVAVLVLEVGHR